MSDYEDNARKSDYEMGSDWNDDDDGDDEEDGDCYSIENENDDNDGNIDGDNEEINGSASCGENDDDLELPSKRARFDSAFQYNSNDRTGNETSFTESKKPAEYERSYGPVASRIMQRMGHKPGTGLGKHGEGNVEPVAASDQKGKRGLGYRPDESVLNRKVDPKVEGISLEEHVEWLQNIHPESDVLTKDVLESWMIKGPEKLSYDCEYHFCTKETLEGVLNGKNNLDGIDESTIKKCRSRANPFETIKGGIFLNRAAMKMANMDYIFDNMFTDPRDQKGEKIIGPNELLYFADVCAGPGGFSEYVFFRKKWRAKGFGFTLREKNDFKLEEFFAGPCETFEPHYGVDIGGDKGDGDIFKPKNIESFHSFVMKNTDGKGVHFMMADGGFSVEEKSFQEIVSKQLYLCQCLVALKVVRVNGNFVVKLFDLFTPFSVGLVYLMYRCFDRISIHKPNTSRPANSERYLICQYKRSNCTDVTDYLYYVNELLCERHRRKEDVLELVQLDIMKDEEDFYDYIVRSNNGLGQKQAFHLQNIVHYKELPDISDSRQEKFKEECLKLWNVPNEARTDPYKGDPKSAIKKLFSDNSDTKFLDEKPTEVNKASFNDSPDYFHTWHWAVVESDKTSDSLTFYLGMSRTNVYRYEGGSWVKFKEFPNFQLPPGTLVYGETVKENIFKPELQKVVYRVNAFHIVDGLFLGYEDIRKECILHRKERCELFAKALSNSNVMYRVKELKMMWNNPYRDLSLSISKLVKPRLLKNRKPAYGFDVAENIFIVPGGLLFFPEANEEWKLHKSNTSINFYYYNMKNKKSDWRNMLLGPKHERKSSIYGQVFADFQNCFTRRRVWWINDWDIKELALDGRENENQRATNSRN